MLLRGNCLELLAEMPDNSVDSIVTDPPYELGFMGKAWDNSGIAYSVQLWTECLRVLKPGGHLLAFGGSRTYHRLACAVEDAGFEIRDQIMWLYGSGFPKSLDVSKAIDKAAGTLKVVGKGKAGKTALGQSSDWNKTNNPHEFNITEPNSPEAQKWAGWGTALKPAHEPIVVARKPLSGTVASNVLEWGTGALNIDASRVAGEVPSVPMAEWTNSGTTGASAKRNGEMFQPSELGRWPANVIHDGSDEVLAGFPTSKSGVAVRSNSGGNTFGGDNPKPPMDDIGYGDSGSAARFFYCAKASKAERNAGLEGLPEKREADRIKDDGVGGDNPRNRSNNARQNFHPTVKPIALMRYLVKMVTPPGGTVLDPFLGSGTTACAAIMEGFEWIGCEMTEDYWPIIEARVAWAEAEYAKISPQQQLF